MRLLLPLTVYFIFYDIYYCSYPGSELNYLFWTAYQGLDYTLEPSIQMLSRFYDVSTDSDIFNLQIGIFDVAKLAVYPEVMSFIFNAWVLKLSVTLGFVHEKLFQSDHGIWLTKAWRTLFFVLVSLPGVYMSSIVSLFCKISMAERAMYVWAFLYLALNSLLIGDPRYLMGTYMIFAFGIARLIAIIRLPTSSA